MTWSAASITAIEWARWGLCQLALLNDPASEWLGCQTSQPGAVIQSLYRKPKHFVVVWWAPQNFGAQVSFHVYDVLTAILAALLFRGYVFRRDWKRPKS